MLYLVRHCSTVENETGILCSNSNQSLSEKGVQEAILVAEWFSKVKIDQILTSDSLRAKETALSINSKTGAPIKVYKELAERFVGSEYANLQFDQLKIIRQNDKWAYDLTQDWFGVTNVESDIDVYNRLCSVLVDNIRSEDNIVCVTHAGVIKSFLHSAFNIDPKRPNTFKVRRGTILAFQNETDFKKLQMVGMHPLL